MLRKCQETSGKVTRQSTSSEYELIFEGQSYPRPIMYSFSLSDRLLIWKILEFGFFVYSHINLRGLFNGKTILAEE